MRLNPIRGLLRIDWSSLGMRSFDVLLALAALGYGLFDGSELLIRIGVMALVLSFFNPMGRIQRGLKRLIGPSGRE